MAIFSDNLTNQALNRQSGLRLTMPLMCPRAAAATQDLPMGHHPDHVILSNSQDDLTQSQAVENITNALATACRAELGQQEHPPKF